MTAPLQFGNDGITIDANAAVPVARFGPQTFANAPAANDRVAARGENGCTAVLPDDDAPVSLDSLATLKPIGQVRDSFILAVNPQGLWIIDQHVAHERVLFEKILRQRLADSPERQQMLMPLLVELTPSQMAVFAEISDELNHNGFEVEPFGTRTIAVKTTAAGVSPAEVEHLLHEILEQFEREEQSLNLEKIRTGVAASHRLPRRHQGQHAAGAKQNGVAAARASEDGLPDELSTWTTGRSAVFCKRHPASLQAYLSQGSRQITHV